MNGRGWRPRQPVCTVFFGSSRRRPLPCGGSNLSVVLLCREKRVKYSAPAECEIIHFVNCEISPFGRCEMKFAHIRVSEYFTFAEQIFHSKAISLARRANFVEKSTCLRKCFFLAGMAGFEPTDARVKVWCLTAWRHPNIYDLNIISQIF